MNKIYNRHGFSLAEMIISVGTMALIGILTIQFFMSAKDVGRRTEELDHSVYLANYIVESAKAGMWDTTPLSDLKKGSQGTDTDGMLLKAFYNEEWEAVDEGSPMSLFEVTVDLEGQVNAIGDLTLYDFSIQIRRLKPYFRGKDIQPILHSLNTKIYTETLEEAKLP